MRNLKTYKQTMEQQSQRACEETKPNHVTFKLTTRSIVRFSPQTMQSLKDGFTVRRHSGRHMCISQHRFSRGYRPGDLFMNY